MDRLTLLLRTKVTDEQLATALREILADPKITERDRRQAERLLARIVPPSPAR